MPRNLPDENWTLDIGASYSEGVASFRVWAPFCKSVDVLVSRENKKKTIHLRMEDRGYFSSACKAEANSDYVFVLDGDKARPDPASRFQPYGVHKASRIVDKKEFEWSDRNWRGLRKEELIIYELHTGTFTKQGLFTSIISKLHYLKDLGVTALELMPIGQFPGTRNWGYDGTYMFAPQNSYGGPDGLKRLIDACHSEGVAVIIDVVYNHFGSEGNYLKEYGPYFSSKYHTPWGDALNYDDKGCDEVRNYIISNSLCWIAEYHVDGLRLDAIHGIFDISPKHILLEISEQTHALAKSLGREFHLISESDLDDPKVIRPKEEGGYESDAQWSDDFHHSIHAYLTGERAGYYRDFGSLNDISKALTEGFVFDGRYSSFRDRRHGMSSRGLPGDKFVIYIQDHDQVGNRLGGERLSTLVSTEKLKLAAALYLLSQNIPMLFMGEEYWENSPFYYFIDHSDKTLIEAVRKARRREFAFKGKAEKFMDPQSVSPFEKSKLKWSQGGTHKEIFRYYRDLIQLRKSHPVFREFDRKTLKVSTNEESECIFQFRRSAREELLLIFS
ncbi:MAG: malto-oligosyltrehalose trehalohydrolase, partial [Thaumarchaeota archaeon]|nr:malto-oligosyltrehalose trehalohydrolase [Nitrososphaerota archaeon]